MPAHSTNLRKSQTFFLRRRTALLGDCLPGLVIAITICLLIYLTPSQGVADNPAPDEPVIDTLVVCPLPFQAEMLRWIAYRESQGHGIVMIQPGDTADALKIQIRRLAKTFPLRNLLLVGDCYSPRINGMPRPPIVPRGRVRAIVNVKYGSEPIICTDNVFADLDDDLLPDLTVGRLSVDSPGELRAVIGKILNYEQNPPPGPWRRKINLVAGVGGFDSVTDRVIESTARQIILKGIPEEFDTSMTYASWRSPYCPDPRHFHDVTVNSLNEGCLFWVYFGHGHIHRLDHVKTPISRFKILNTGDKHKLKANGGLPIAMLLACYTGAMDSIDDCLAEEMVEAEGGPVAVLAGSRVTMPYAMAVLSHEMLLEFFEGECDTLGELILRAKRKLGEKRTDRRDSIRGAIDGLASFFSPNRDQLAEERLEHVQLFNLLGDPLLRLPRSEKIDLTLPKSITAGETVRIDGTTPHDGRLLVELSYDRSKLPFKPSDRKEFQWTYQFLNQLQAEYVSANHKTVAQHSFLVKKGAFNLRFPVPDKLQRGKFQIRAFLEKEGEGTFAIGSAGTRIR